MKFFFYAISSSAVQISEMLSFVIFSSRAAQDSKESQESQEAKKGTCLCWSEKHYAVVKAHLPQIRFALDFPASFNTTPQIWDRTPDLSFRTAAHLFVLLSRR